MKKTKPKSVKQIGEQLAERLRKNAAVCREDARLNLLAAAKVIKLGGDDDEVDGFLLDARWQLGEARGHLNAAYDVCEELGLPT